MPPPDEGPKIAEVLDKVVGPNGSPKLKGWMVDLGTDEAGDLAVYITALLDDATPDTDWTSQKLEPIADRAREALRAAGVTRWPYLRFARLSEAGGASPDQPEWRAA